MGFAAWGWTVEFSPLPQAEPNLAMRVQTIAIRSLKSLTLMDFDFDKILQPKARLLIFASQLFGAIFSLLIAGRILLAAVGLWLAEWRLSLRSRHDVVVGSGQAASEYVAYAGHKLTHTAAELETTLGPVAMLSRVGPLDRQLRRAAAKRARRIVVDEGDDSATWQTAQIAAHLHPNTDVLAYIRDPWVQERLSRAPSAERLKAFSYAGGVARQVMLAHPPYLLARRYQAPAQHILIFGFGSVGQSIAREFLVTSLSLDPARVMITAVDPDIARLGGSFMKRLPGLETDVDVDFVAGNFMMENDDLMRRIRERATASEICAVYVCIDNDNLPLSLGMALRDQAIELGVRAPIFLCAQHGAGLSEVRQGAGLTGGGDGEDVSRQASEQALIYDRRLTSFGSWEDALDGCGLFEKQLDRLARTFHDVYCRLHPLPAGDAPDAALEPWGRLSDEFRVSNRRVAAHIRAKADSVGYDLNPGLRAVKTDGGRMTCRRPPTPSIWKTLARWTGFRPLNIAAGGWTARSTDGVSGHATLPPRRAPT